MARTLNELVRDAVLRRAILEGRVLNGHVRDLDDIFRRARGEMRLAVLEGDFARVDELSRRDLSDLLARAREAFEEAMAEAVPTIASASADAATLGLEFWNDALADAFPDRLAPFLETSRVDPEFVRAALDWPIMEGGDTPPAWGTNKVRAFGRSARFQAAQAAGFGETVGQLARRFTRLNATLGRFDAETAARSAFIHAGGRVAERWAERNDDVVGGLQWTATLDDRTCRRCGGLDGETWEVGDPSPALPLHPRCRCSKVPWIRSWRELGIDADELTPGMRASMNGEVPDAPSYDEWLRGLPRADQRDILGPGVFDIWEKDGRPDLGSYTDNGRRILRIDELTESRLSA